MDPHDEIVRVLSAGPAVLASDFDGTLARIVSHPDLASPLQGVVAALSKLSKRDRLEVVVISGRPHADLAARLGSAPGVVLIGEHGNDFGEGPDADTAMDHLAERVSGIANVVAGILIETKKRSIAVHFRNADPASAANTVKQLRELAEAEQLRIVGGKMVIELTRAQGTKGDALLDIAAGRPIVYFGDDLTDESVFGVLGADDVGVKVGEGKTDAKFRLSDPQAVADLLGRVAERLS